MHNCIHSVLLLDAIAAVIAVAILILGTMRIIKSRERHSRGLLYTDAQTQKLELHLHCFSKNTTLLSKSPLN